MPYRLLIAALAALGTALPASPQARADYALAQTLAIPQGELQILEDGRITPKIEKKMWESCVDPAFVFPKSEARQFDNNPPRPARLRQLDSSGRIVADLVPHEYAPIAHIGVDPIGPPDRPIFIIETDNDACMGSYSGRVSLFFQMENGRIAPVMLTDEAGRAAQVVMISTPRSQARFAKKTLDEIVIHQVSSHVDFEKAKTAPKDKPLPFVIDYITIRFDGSKWTRALRSAPGSWEAGDGTPFPPATKFP